jgi:DnaJ domain
MKREGRMFERNRVDNQDHGTIMIEVTFDDGRTLIGRLSLPSGRSLFDHLNGPHAYLEFEPLEGERAVFAKSTVKSARAIAPVKGSAITQRLRDLDGFDPYQILGLERGRDWDDVRSAYHRLAKAYHPDRYATAELPEEVITYLSGMARRVNAAYAALEAAYAQKRQYAKFRQEPIYTSPVRQ